MSENFVTIATFTYPQELDIIIARFDAEGIAYFTSDEYTVSVNPFLSNAIGGIKLNVPEEDAERAFAIFQEIEKNNQENNLTETDDEEEKEFKKEIETSNKNLGKGCIIVIILIGLAIIASIIYTIFTG
jgi:hypothetical protein